MSLEDLLEDLEQTEKEIGQEETIDSSSGAGEGGAGTGGLFGSTTFTGSSAQSLADGFSQPGSGLFGDGLGMSENDLDLPDQGGTPSDDVFGEDDVFEMLYAIMSGRQGVPEGTSEELLSALESALAGANQEQIDSIAEEILAAGGFEEWLASQETEEDLDVLADTTAGDTTADDTATTDGGTTTTNNGTTTTQQQSVWDRIKNQLRTIYGSSTAPGLPGGAGVIIDFEDIDWSDPNTWKVFLPGIIPGLPQSSTIIGTIGDILSAPEDVLGGVWDEIKRTAEDPLGVLEDLLNEAADTEGLITLGGLGGVIGTLYDEYFGDDTTTTTTTGEGTGTTLGGAGAEEEDEEPGAATTTTTTTTTTGEGGQTDLGSDLSFSGGEDGPVTVGGTGVTGVGEETEQEVGGTGTAFSAAGGGGGGGQVASRPSFGEFTPFMKRIQYQPVAVPKAIVPDAPIVSSLFEEYLK